MPMTIGEQYRQSNLEGRCCSIYGELIENSSTHLRQRARVAVEIV